MVVEFTVWFDLFVAREEVEFEMFVSFPSSKGKDLETETSSLLLQHFNAKT
jgi:hypothetical protein